MDISYIIVDIYNGHHISSYIMSTINGLSWPGSLELCEELRSAIHFLKGRTAPGLPPKAIGGCKAVGRQALINQNNTLYDMD